MVWLQSVLLFVHIVGAIFWFGSGLFLQVVMLPAIRAMQFESQKSIFMALAGRYGKIIGPIGGLTVLFGFLRGLVAGVFGNLGSAYGITFLAAIAGAVFVIVVGARFIGPTAEKLVQASSREEVLQLAGKIQGYGRYDTGGMLVMIALMVAMRAGY